MKDSPIGEWMAIRNNEYEIKLGETFPVIQKIEHEGDRVDEVIFLIGTKEHNIDLPMLKIFAKKVSPFF